MEVTSTLLAISGAYTYVAVKASLHGTYTSLFGLNEDEVKALVKKFSSYKKDVNNGVLPKATLVDVINGVLLKATPIDAINALGQLGYRVVCSTGEAEIVWTMQRDL